MSEFNISGYITILKEGMQDTQENVTRTLFDAVCLSMNNPVDLKPKFITSLIQRKVEVQNEIKKPQPILRSLPKLKTILMMWYFPK